MHAEAWGFLKNYATRDALDILDVGGRDVNSSLQGYDLKTLFPKSRIIVVDKEAGANVDIIADAIIWMPNH